MGLTIVEKIFCKKTEKSLAPGDTVFAPVDYVMGTDGTAPLAIDIFKKMKVSRVKRPDRVFLVNDHFIPANNIASAEAVKCMRTFASEYGINNYFEVGRSGICHVLIPELGIIEPGEIVVGADSHTVTYGALGAFSTGIGSTDMACVLATGGLWFRIPKTIKVILSGKLNKNVFAKDIILYLISLIGVEGANYCVFEFYGKVISEMDMAGRFTLCNMVVEMGAKAGIIPPDEITEKYYEKFKKRVNDEFVADENAKYKEIIEINIEKVYPAIACPYLPSNVTWAKEMRGTKIDQVVIGSCTNGRIEDFRVAHSLIKEKKFDKAIRVIIIPGSQQVLCNLIEEGILTDFIEAGAVISPPTCGACMGGHMGVLAEGEVGLYTTNRNFYGRNGHKNSKVYLCNPVIAAASALSGVIDVPKECE